MSMDELAIEALSAAYDRKMSACSLGGMYDPEDEMIFSYGWPARKNPGAVSVTDENGRENGQGRACYELDRA